MNLIKQLNSLPPVIKEDAAGGSTGGGSIAAASMPLFSTLVQRAVPKHPRIINFGSTKKPKTKKPGVGLKEAFYSLHEDLSKPDNTDTSFDTSEVISKLKSLEDKESVDYRDTSTFGLVDGNGDIVRVSIPTDQAQGFEQDIQRFLGSRDESEQAPEIAEVLFKLKDRYTIVNVEWPQVEEDQEEGQELNMGDENAMPGDEMGGEAMPGDEIPMDSGADTGKVEDLLTQVIDMMKADADARKAEAQAREAEAKTKQANAAREQAMARVKQEEQFLDMDEYNKNQKAKEKEAKRLAQLAKWKHDMDNNEELPAQDPQYDFVPGEEEEEVFSHPQQTKPQPANKAGMIRGRVSPSDIAKFIVSRAR